MSAPLDRFQKGAAARIANMLVGHAVIVDVDSLVGDRRLGSVGVSLHIDEAGTRRRYAVRVVGLNGYPCIDLEADLFTAPAAIAHAYVACNALDLGRTAP